ncbi:MAG TPA: hypothetical protein PLP25_07275 [Candidatus Limiplasma sp.]|nr:hypothetical protein [Candidatus Limiplasma sp.]HPS81644.1 hypothetical protein [Candidatus Limiplasma sp.]
MNKVDRLVNRNETSRWIFSALTVLLLLAGVFAFSDITFDTNDDCTIISIAAGYLTGAPDAATVYTSYGYGRLLAALYGWIGALPWHTLLLIAVNALADMALLVGCLSLCANKGARFYHGLLAFLALFFGVLLEYTAQLQFTAVSGVAFAAALVLASTLPANAGRKLKISRSALAALFATVSLGLRPNVALMLCPMAILFAAGCLLRRAPQRRWVALTCAGLTALVVAGYAADGALYGRQTGWQAFQDFDSQATQLLDYQAQPISSARYEAALKAAGWTVELGGMVRNWYFWDRRVDTAHLKALNQSLAQSATQTGFLGRVASVARATASIVKRYPVYRWNLLGWGLAALIAAIAALAHRRRWLAAQLAVHFGYLLALIAYFYGVLGRYPLRLAFAAAVPFYALLLPVLADALAVSSLDRPLLKVGKRLGAGMLAALALGAGLCLSLDGVRGLSARNAQPTGNRNAALSNAVNAYVSQHSDTLYFTDFCEDFDPFAQYAPGSLQNLIYWGSGVTRSPAAYRQMSAWGLTELDARHFFDGSVALLLTGGESARERLAQYLTADYGLQSLTVAEQADGFTVYRATRKPEAP